MSRAQKIEGFWSLYLKVFCWLRPSSKSSHQKERSWKREQGMPLAWLPVPILIPGKDDNFLFYVWVIHTARSDSACLLSVSLTDGWLPDITHWVKLPLILNMTALTLLFIFFLYKIFPFPVQDIQLADFTFLSIAAWKKKEAGHHGTSKVAPRVAFVLGKELRLFLLKEGHLQQTAPSSNICPLLH